MKRTILLIIALIIVIGSFHALAEETSSPTDGSATQQPDWVKNLERWKDQKDWSVLTSKDVESAPENVIEGATHEQAYNYIRSTRFKIKGIPISQLGSNEYKLLQKALPGFDLSVLKKEGNEKLKDKLVIKPDKFQAKCLDCPYGFTLESKTKGGGTSAVRVAGDYYKAKLNDDGTLTVTHDGKDLLTVTDGSASAVGLTRTIFGGSKVEGILLTPSDRKGTSFKYHSDDGTLKGSVSATTRFTYGSIGCDSTSSCIHVDDSNHLIGIEAHDNNKIRIDTDPRVWKTRLNNEITDDSAVTVHMEGAKCCFVTARKTGIDALGAGEQAQANFETPHIHMTPSPGGSTIDYAPPSSASTPVGHISSFSPLSPSEITQLEQSLLSRFDGKLQLESPIRSASISPDGHILVKQKNGDSFIVPPSIKKDGTLYDYANGAWRRVDINSGAISALNPMTVPETVRQLMQSTEPSRINTPEVALSVQHPIDLPRPDTSRFNYEGNRDYMGSSDLSSSQRSRLLNLQNTYGLRFVEGSSKSNDLKVYDRQGNPIASTHLFLNRRWGDDLIEQIEQKHK